jgi:hypothetical protein
MFSPHPLENAFITLGFTNILEGIICFFNPLLSAPPHHYLKDLERVENLRLKSTY